MEFLENRKRNGWTFIRQLNLYRYNIKMSGALVELVALGIQDVQLTGDPQTTYFRQTYKRHTNFAIEPVRQVIEGQPSSGNWSEISISRSGDLLVDVYFLGLTGNTAINIPFDEVDLYIGGLKIDSLTNTENVACAQMFRPSFSSSALTSADVVTAKGSHSLQFFFGRGFQSALPLLALQYHDVTLRIKWNANFTNDVGIYADYVQLDTKERNAFVKTPITMLIEQHQRVPMTLVTTGETYTNLTFSHPVKVIYGSELQTIAGNLVLPLNSKMKLEFNGKERMPLLPTGNYYQDHQFGKHTEHNATDNGPMYSFALYANRLSPTGSCNFSRLDNARLTIDGTGAHLGTSQGDFFCINWNFLKIENGMGGLLFAN